MQQPAKSQTASLPVRLGPRTEAGAARTSDFAARLREHRYLCSEILKLVQKENNLLRSHSGSSASPAPTGASPARTSHLNPQPSTLNPSLPAPIMASAAPIMASAARIEAGAARTKNLLADLSDSLDKVRELRVAWLKLPPGQKQGHPEIAELLRENQNLIMKILVLDRENEQTLLRQGFNPSRPSAATPRPAAAYARLAPAVERPQAGTAPQRPHFVTSMYQRNAEL